MQRYHFDALCYNLIIIAGSSNLANHVVIENMKSENRKLTQKVKSGAVDDEVVISAENIKKTRGFMQIPNTQITLSNGVLIQNSGW